MISEVEMQINLLTEFKELKEQVDELRKELKRQDLMIKVERLKDYENQEDLKRKLGIGQGLLNEWVAKGLEKQVWSDRNIRYEIDELKAFLKKEYAV